MTFDQYIENPLGKKNAVFGNRDMYKAMYTEKFGNINLREAGNIKYTLFQDKKNDVYYCHIAIPSEVVPKFYYDTVIRFYTNDNGLRTGGSLTGYDVQFYSNDPSFVFTYMYVFQKNGMLVEDLKEKSPKMALKRKPDEKNPYMIPGYVKSIYFAYILMKMKGLFLKSSYTAYAVPYDKKKLLSMVTDADKKIADRQAAGEKLQADKKKAASDTAKKKAEMILGASKSGKRIKTVSSASTTAKSVRTAGTKSVGRIKSVKKI